MQITAPRLLAIGLTAAALWAANEVKGTAASTAAQIAGVPQVSLNAYVAAAEGAPTSCGLHASLIAGIGAVETGHGTFGGSSPDPATGVITPPIRGPQLDGGQFALIVDSDNGALDGDMAYDRAVGGMQFIPGTWRVYAPAGADPQNMFDATKATAALLCAVSKHEGRPLTDPAVEEAAIRAYNNSAEYVASVRRFRDDFLALDGANATGGQVTAADIAAKLSDEGRARWVALGGRIERTPGVGLDRVYSAVDPLANVLWNTMGSTSSDVVASLSSTASAAGQITVDGITVSANVSDQVAAMIAAARADGVTLTGSGFRSADEQMALRVQNCPDPVNSDPGACSPATAKVGTSNHERGLAIDFRDGNGVSLTSGSPGFGWLSANAARFGFHKLPSEPWHWSVDGR